ncbi:hypothetical protein MGN70_013831 [Eutypa lata]|nr:hypothetical protein MGN70_013831 [Eutypa lata]
MRLINGVRFSPVAAYDATVSREFYAGLGISNLEAESLEASLAEAEVQKVPVLGTACKVAQLALGEDQVDLAPLNQTIVGENWSQACVVEPHCILQPINTDQVSTSIKIIDFHQAKFAIRSGVHPPNPGSSSIGEGILVDLQRLKEVSLTSDKAIVSVAPGAKWGDVTAVTDPSGVTVIGARMPSIGAGGSIIGGQY